jgi:hypothetical protein
MTFFDANETLLDQQHGFRSKRSCESQLMIAVHDLALSMNNRKQTDIIILDFAKAFDKVPHERLLHKLDYYGIRGKTNKWMRTFLTQRHQRVVVDGEAVDYTPVHLEYHKVQW